MTAPSRSRLGKTRAARKNAHGSEKRVRLGIGFAENYALPNGRASLSALSMGEFG